MQRYKFNSRNHHLVETNASYVAELKRLTKQCDYKDSLLDTLDDCLVYGMNDQVMQHQLLTE